MPTVNYNQPCPVSDITITFPSTSGTLATTASVADEKAKVSANDTTAGYLNGKLVAGTNVTFTENNDGGNETLTIAAAGGVTGFTGSQNTASPNNSVNASRLLVNATSTNADFVAQPKGTGAFQLQLADNAATGGNKRGTNAIDLQTLRSTANQVASGLYSFAFGSYNVASGQFSGAIGSSNNVSQNSCFAIGSNNSMTQAANAICIGHNNSVSSSNAAVLGGNQNSVDMSSINAVIVGGNNNFVGSGVDGRYSCILGGQSNTVYGQYSTIAGGQSNNVGASSSGCTHAFIGAGSGNTARGNYSIVVGGNQNTVSASATFSTIVGGSQNVVDTGKQYSVITGGQGARVRDNGVSCFANHYFATQGDTQLVDTIYQGRNTTGSSYIGIAGSSGAGSGISVPTSTAVAFRFLVTCRQTGNTNVGAWEITGLVSNDGGTLTAYNIAYNNIHKSVGTMDVQIVANSTSDTIDLLVTNFSVVTQWTAVARFAFTTIV
jgi:hypothetical protein